MDRSTFAKGLAWTVLVNLINKAVFPLISIIISRLLGPGPLGAFAVLSTIMAISEIFRDAGLTQTYLADQEVDDRKIRSYTALAVVMALVPALLLFVSRGWLAEALDLPELRTGLLVACLALVFNGFATMPRAQLLRDTKIKELAIIDLISGGTGIILTIVLVLMGFAFWSLVIQLGYCSLLTLWLSHRVAPIRPMLLEGREVGSCFRRTGALLAANALNNLFLMSDVFVIRKLLESNVLLGLFGQGKNIAYKPADFVTFPLSRMLIVAFSQSASDHAKLCRVYAKSLTATLLFVTPVYLLLIFASEPIIALLLGPKFAGSAAVLSVMSVFLAMRTIGTIAGTALVSYGKAKLTLVAQIAGILVTVGVLGSQLGAIAMPRYSSIAEFAAARQVELGAERYEVNPEVATYPDERSGKRESAQKVRYTLPSGRVLSEYVATVSGRAEPLEDGVRTKGFEPTPSKEDWAAATVDNASYVAPQGMARLLRIVWSFTFGAIALYGLCFLMTIAHFPPPVEDRRKIFTALALCAMTGSLIALTDRIPGIGLWKLAIMLVLLPLFHVAAIGMSLERKPLAYLSVAGVKRLFGSL